MCCRSTKLDIQALIDRLGGDHGSMHDDLVGLFVCSNCKAAGRDRRQVESALGCGLQRHAVNSHGAGGLLQSGNSDWEAAIAQLPCDMRVCQPNG
ncbi:hypothetical protein, partial [Mesorhizobium sp.]|uniref:hypothetical protein n=1 Tax=Mesorhizobium sp. TaxID=1871066 RepID=UPI00257E9D56